MQVMPGTWSHLAPKLGVTSPWQVKDNIQAGIYYDARLWTIWKAPRPLEERIAFTLACYNAGPGNIIQAQGLVPFGQSNEWAPVAAQLYRVTGRHAVETRGYVIRIQYLYLILLESTYSVKADPLS
jgi:soluble lytic murein transglycosylase-like protein